MAKVKGIWVFNQIFADGEFDLPITGVYFTSYGMEFEGIHPSGGLSSSGGYKSVMYYKRKGAVAWDVIAQSSYHGYATGWQNDALRTIDFGETEQTVPDDFYAWFTINATQQEEPELEEPIPEEPEQPISTLKFTHLYLGISAAANGNRRLRKLQTTAYIKLISFTIDDTTYQAEEGMTWGQWCESDYNTGSYYVNENLGGWVILSSTSWVVPNGSLDHIYGTDVIISGGEYAVYYD